MDLMKNKIRNFLLTLLLFSPITSASSNEKGFPPAVPLSKDDIEDPQKGYMHIPQGMEGGTFMYAKKGDPTGKTEKVELEKFTFLEGFRTEVINGFTPTIGVCIFMDKWSCFIADSEEVINKTLSQQFTNNLSPIHESDMIFCEDCKPTPVPLFSRICPGYYRAHITNEVVEDKTLPTYPEFFSKEGNCIYEKPWFIASKNEKKEIKNNGIENINQIVILQSAFNRCMLEEKLLTKQQLITMTSEGAKVNPQLFNPVMQILKNGETKSQKEGQDIFINKLGGCKNFLRTFISTTMKEDSEEMMKLLDKQGFNDDLLGRPKSYFDQNLKMVFCKEPIPEFTLNYNSNPSDKEVASLCSCIWNKFPEGRWEREEMRRIFKGGDPTWRTRGMFNRFGKAMKVCGGYEL